jgi:glutathione S-transferase
VPPTRRASPSAGREKGAMIDLHYWPTPNGWKITIMLEECGLAYAVISVNISKGDQYME